MIIKELCPNKDCRQVQKEVSSSIQAQWKFIKLACGHTIVRDLAKDKEDKIIAIDGSTLREYQEEGIKFAIEKANLRCLFADEMGLGKTVQILGTLKRTKETSFPCIFILKSSLLTQWSREIIRWIGAEFAGQVITSSKDIILPGFNSYLITYDLVRTVGPQKLLETIQPKTVVLDEVQQIKNRTAKRTIAIQGLVSGQYTKKRTPKELRDRKIVETIALDLMKYHGVYPRFTLQFEDLGPKILGMTECHHASEGIIEGRITLNIQHAKCDSLEEVIETILHEIAHAITPGAGHKTIWSETCKGIGGDGKAVAWCNGTVEIKNEITHSVNNVLAASGTYIKNNAAEAFVVLNLLYPNKFNSFQEFEKTYVDGYSTPYGNKHGGIKPWMLDEWNRVTGEFVIRRERADVLKDLPPVNRQFFHTELGPVVERMYRAVMKKFEDAFDEYESASGQEKTQKMSNVLAYMSKMRHITGLAKIDPCVEWVDEFIEEEKDKKLAIFIHHQDVGEMLFRKLDQKYPGKVVKYTSDMDQDTRQRAVDRFRSNAQIFIASTLAAGEGLNLQFCSDMILLERQWNPANEEQVEGRFARIGQVANYINSTYVLATGTIDEFFADLVERKRKFMLQTLRGSEMIKFEEGSLLRELAEILYQKGKKWKLK